MEEREIIHDTENQQFILLLDDGLQATVSYTLNDHHMDLVHSEVPYSLRGQGVGKELVEKTFQKLTDEGFDATAICGYIRVIARRSPKWREIIAH